MRESCVSAVRSRSCSCRVGVLDILVWFGYCHGEPLLVCRLQSSLMNEPFTMLTPRLTVIDPVKALGAIHDVAAFYN